MIGILEFVSCKPVSDNRAQYILALHLTIRTESGEKIWVDTNDVWDKNDLVGINILPKDIALEKVEEDG